MIRAIAPLLALAIVAYILIRLSEQIPPLSLIAYVIVFALAVDLMLYLLIPLIAVAMKIGDGDGKFLKRWNRDRVVLKPLLYHAVLTYSGIVASTLRLVSITYLTLLFLASTLTTAIVILGYSRSRSRIAALSLTLALLLYSIYSASMLHQLKVI